MVQRMRVLNKRNVARKGMIARRFTRRGTANGWNMSRDGETCGGGCKSGYKFEGDLKCEDSAAQ